MHTPIDRTPQGLHPLRIVALIEGATLLALLGIAVPLKHLAGYSTAVTVIGPIHGVAFLLYFWMVFNVASSDGWTRGEIARLVVTAFVPFGALLNAGFLNRKSASFIAHWHGQPAEHGLVMFLWIKALHIAAIVIWVSGLLLLALLIRAFWRPLQHPACPKSGA